MTKNKKLLYSAVYCLAAFILWTLMVCTIDVKPIGPQNSFVGFSTINSFFHNLTGVHLDLYIITDWLSIIPAMIILAFGLLGLVQWIKRKSIVKVDFSLLMLGAFYIVVMTMYVFFELVVINFRPVLIDGVLEASYPSSTTMLVMCVMPTALMQLNLRIKNNKLKNIVRVSVIIFTAFMVVCRLVSGVHWISDIIGGTLLSCSLVMMYCYMCSFENK